MLQELVDFFLKKMPPIPGLMFAPRLASFLFVPGKQWQETLVPGFGGTGEIKIFISFLWQTIKPLSRLKAVLEPPMRK